jgi:hypothetical protein
MIAREDQGKSGGGEGHPPVVLQNFETGKRRDE